MSEKNEENKVVSEVSGKVSDERNTHDLSEVSEEKGEENTNVSEKTREETMPDRRKRKRNTDVQTDRPQPESQPTSYRSDMNTFVFDVP